MTLYQVLDVPETVPPEMVGSAALLNAGEAGSEVRRTAVAVLSNPEARADYDARAAQGLSFELALAWGLAALAAGDRAMAHYHWERAQRILPDSRAVAVLLAEVSDAPAEPEMEIPEELRAAARAEVERLRHNSAFPHRLIRYAEVMTRPDDGETEPSRPDGPVEAMVDSTGKAAEAALDSDMMAGAARELLQYDIVEAPRAYSMILPVLRDHYRSVYALDAPFFDATISLLSGHTPRAEYERKKNAQKRPHEGAPEGDYGLSDLIGPAGPTGPVGPSARHREDRPPPEAPRRRMATPALRLPNPGPAWIGALFGALFGLRMGPAGMIRGALFGFLIAYIILVIMDRRR